MKKDIVLGVLRHGLGAAGAALVAAHPTWLASDDVNTIIGSVMAIAAVVWSVVEKANRSA